MNTKREDNIEAAIAAIKSAGEKFGSTFICRDKVGAFTGGAISSAHLANLDSQGVGVPNSFKIGRRQCYPVQSLVDWLISRLEVR